MNHLTWCGENLNISLKGAVQLQLRGPMVYIFDGPPSARNEEPAAIDVRLPVSEHGYVPTIPELGYWPRYDSLTPSQRRYYLTWLAQRRASIPLELGYAFLFIYGLERRALVEQADQQLIAREVAQLRQLYSASGQPKSHSFESYTSAFLWFILIQNPTRFTEVDVRALFQGPTMWTEQTLASALYWFGATGMSLPDWAAMRIAQSLPTSQLSSVPKRVSNEFEKLFSLRYAERLPSGLQAPLSSRSRSFLYRPSSAALRSITYSAPDPLPDAAYYKPLSEIWNDCIAALHKFSTVVGKTSVATDSAERWEALPAELRRGTLHPLTDSFCQILHSRESTSGVAVVHAAELAPLIRIQQPLKFTAGQCRTLSQIASQIGYCLEPDPLVTNRAWKVDQPIAVFLRLSDDEVDIRRYPAAACMLQIAVAVTSADGTITEKTLTDLILQIANLFELNEAELRRLVAVGALLAISGADLSIVTRIVQDLPAAQREKMAKLTLALASTDDVITTAELRIIRRVYASMGFAKEEVQRAVMALRRDDEPAAVIRRGIRNRGEQIPASAHSASKALQLNHAAIAEIMKDTHEVTEMLAAAMSLPEDEDHESQRPGTPPDKIPNASALERGVKAPTDFAAQSVQSSLPERYRVLYELLIAQREWAITDAEALARQFGLMLSGAVEAINEWSFEIYGEPLLIEQKDCLIVETAAAQ